MLRLRHEATIVIEAWRRHYNAVRPHRSLKTERMARKFYGSREQAGSDVLDLIARFYNPTRRHSALGYVRHIQFEESREAWVSVHQAGSSSGTVHQREA